jgi:peptidoglycan hydrolase-like protein with peptidoglycan-binding domain
MANFNYSLIQGVQGNVHVTPEFIAGVEAMAGRLGTKPEYLLAAMSFETGGSFNPAIRNGIGATGLIQFLKSTARGLGTTTDKLAKMTAVAQLEFVEKYLKPFTGKLNSLEAVYTSILSGSPKKPDAVLFKAGTPEYKLNPLDWNNDGIITAREATLVVAARMFGGVKAVQKKLLEAGVVPAAAQPGFVDGRWGAGSTQALAAFQKKNKLEPTGLMDEATGEALFGTIEAAAAAAATSAAVIEPEAQTDAVGLLQDALIAFGYLTLEQVGSFRGHFGPRTKAALKAFQSHVGLDASGVYGDTEQRTLKDILKGVSQGCPNTHLVKVIQKRLVELKYMTPEQVNTGAGTFGGRTAAAVKGFQSDNKLAASGVVEADTFKAMFNGVAAARPNASGVFTATDGEHYRVVSEILMTESLREKLAAVANRYFSLTGKDLIITSGYRPPDRQARAMQRKITVEGETKVRKLYKNKAAIDEILNAYRRNAGDPVAAIAAIEKTVEDQVRRGVFISNHLRSNAVDVRKPTTNLASLRQAVAHVGGRVVIEGDHYHLEL